MILQNGLLLDHSDEMINHLKDLTKEHGKILHIFELQNLETGDRYLVKSFNYLLSGYMGTSQTLEEELKRTPIDHWTKRILFTHVPSEIGGVGPQPHADTDDVFECVVKEVCPASGMKLFKKLVPVLKLVK
jgi:hypothetical protein